MRRVPALVVAVLICSSLVLAQRGQPQAPVATRYFPPAGQWERVDPATVGMDKAKLADAIAYHEANQNTNTRNLAEDIPRTFRNEAPYNNLIGPTQERTGANGVIIRRGKVVAEWGDTDRADMTFSVTKTFLSTVVGLAYDQGLIKDLHARVATQMPSGVDLFTTPHNAKITWDQLLRQTSSWHGTLWGKPSWADRPPNGVPAEEWPNQPLPEPGTVYKYNDVRVNVLALATLHLVKRELPAVLKESIMDPIGASNTWHWEAYDNAVVTIDGKKMRSIPGGGHHGGGMFISAWDMARFGYLYANYGNWAGKQLISERWIDMARTPGVNRTYGFMNWMLNTPTRGRGGALSSPKPSAPRASVTFEGNGSNIIYVDWDNDIVAVVRWIRGSFDQFASRMLAAIKH